MFFKKKKTQEEKIEEIVNLEDNLETEIVEPISDEMLEEEIILEEVTEKTSEEASTLIQEPTYIEEEIEEEFNEETVKDQAIYILGDNALACFLAMKFTKAGEKVVLITNKEKASTLSNNGITIIENHSLQKNHYKFATTFWLKETPKMLLITSDAIKLNASLTAISRKKIVNTPVLLFTPIKNPLYIKNILENDIYRAFFDGYLLNQSDQIILFGRSPSVTFSPKGRKKKQSSLITACFNKADLTLKTEKDEEKAFWDYFSVYTACSLVSAAYNKNIFDVIKDKDKRERLIPLIMEICKLAKHDGVDLNSDEILKKIYNTPLSYPYPLQVEIAKGKAGDFDLISSNLINISRKNKCKIDELDALLKKIYNIIMA
ncbi:MAG: 2-dehydropantoate 2-reductase N-terminal domain-containing protein [Alphaproteobacteria bacterium]|nr:2-dehydropantoate 2-reductase N-terminal domain-containing protein [Alphaproteobacteria bacterium]